MKGKVISAISVLLCLILSLSGCGSKVSNSQSSVTSAVGKQDLEVELPEEPEIDTVSLWDGEIATGFGGGSGTSTDPYLIKNAAQLAHLSECCKKGYTFLGEFIRLETNINLNGREWYPIGQFTYGNSNNDFAFQGTFDGNNCYVSNFVINVNVLTEKDVDIDVGLFGYANAAYIKDLVVKNFNYFDRGQRPYVGGLLGRAWGDTTVENCHVQHGFISVKAADTEVGGLIGGISGTKEYRVANCSADANIVVECSIYHDLTYEKDGKSYYYGNLSFLVGGLIGKAEDIPIYNCFSTGTVSGTMITDANRFNGDFIGGLVGYTSNASVRSCYSTATVKTQDVEDEGYIGGLIGLAGGSVTTSYSAGKIECSSPDFYCGGLVGGTYDPISNCFSMTDIYAKGEDMGCHTLVGVIEKDEVTVKNCYISNKAVIENKDSYSFPRGINVTSVDPDRFNDKALVGENIGFIPYDPSTIEAGKYYSGWIFSDDSLPKMFYEKLMAPQENSSEKNPAVYLGMTAKELIEELGQDYSQEGNRISYPNLNITFEVEMKSQTILGNEKIVVVYVGGEQNLGGNLNSAMTFGALKEAIKQEIPKPSYLEMDDTYITSFEMGDYYYSYCWWTNDYDTEKSNGVTITKKQLNG